MNIFKRIKNTIFPDVENSGSNPGSKGYTGSMKTSELQPGAETGVLIKQPDPRAWIAGGETGMAGVLEEDGQYDSYLPDEEAQSFYTPADFDTQSCVTFSGTNNLEIILNRLRAKKLLSARQENFLQQEGYINPQTNKVNFSDRFTAKMSGTTQKGNYLEAVGDSMRKDGLVPESVWPMPDWNSLAGKTQDEIWEIYMAEIPQKVKDKAKKFLDYFTINYQWIALGSSTPEMFKNSLKQGPFQIAAIVCSPWNSTEGMPPIKACGCGTGHATVIYGYKEGAWKLFDHYRSFKKLITEDYCIQWALQYGIKENNPTDQIPLNHVFKINLKYKMAETVEVRAMQKALQTLKGADGKPYMTPGTFGPYGPVTKIALGKFQIEKGINDPDGPGMNFGPATRAAMNKALQTIN